MVGFSFGDDGLALHRHSERDARRKPVHIPRPKIWELAHKTQGAGIFAYGEYPAKPTTPLVMQNSAPHLRSAVHYFPIQAFGV